MHLLQEADWIKLSSVLIFDNHASTQKMLTLPPFFVDCLRYTQPKVSQWQINAFTYDYSISGVLTICFLKSPLTSDLSHCQCDYYEASEAGEAEQDVGMNYEATITTCSRAAWQMGSRQKVIAFTYFKGRKDEEISRKYEAGIFGNLEAIGQYYNSEESLEDEASEWSMRVYHNLEDDDVDLCRLACSNRESGGRFGKKRRRPPLVLCNVNRNPLFGNASVILPTLWRFLPMLDDQVGKNRIEFIKLCAKLLFIS